MAEVGQAAEVVEVVGALVVLIQEWLPVYLD